SPTLGIVVAFASVSAGWNATLVVAPTDALLAGITTDAAHIMDEDVVVTPLSNYFFNAVSAILLAFLITLVTELVLRKRTAGLDNNAAENDSLGEYTLRPEERRGVRAAGLSLLVFAAQFTIALVPEGSWFRGPDGTAMESPLSSGLSVVLALALLAVGVAYRVMADT